MPRLERMAGPRAIKATYHDSCHTNAMGTYSFCYRWYKDTAERLFGTNKWDSSTSDLRIVTLIQYIITDTPYTTWQHVTSREWKSWKSLGTPILKDLRTQPRTSVLYTSGVLCLSWNMLMLFSNTTWCSFTSARTSKMTRITIAAVRHHGCTSALPAVTPLKTPNNHY